ncbi:hypothetical protein T03_9822 [Trichinella britovi]|uniref:Uncharacterized protein n=1 Tax=Trichinella britovi TaxID=45882 RepID=A0A0V1B0F0_TRIBR|nr:hypothetical protein T03_12920 [Trichinella britovi]KRY30425.1 hypothetical protein T03_9822 [Trichinella britovi]
MNVKQTVSESSLNMVVCYSANSATLLSFYCNWVVLIQFFYELKITFALLHFENAQMQCIISKDGLCHDLSFYEVLFVLGTVKSHVQIISF